MFKNTSSALISLGENLILFVHMHFVFYMILIPKNLRSSNPFSATVIILIAPEHYKIPSGKGEWGKGMTMYHIVLSLIVAFHISFAKF